MRVRKLGSGSLITRAGTLHGGEEADLPSDIVERYLHKLEVLEDLPLPTPTAPDQVDAAFDASTLTIGDVLAAVEEGRVTALDALDSERAGKARKTLLAELQDRVDRDAHQL